jgi:hypothetical protein
MRLVLQSVNSIVQQPRLIGQIPEVPWDVIIHRKYLYHNTAGAHESDARLPRAVHSEQHISIPHRLDLLQERQILEKYPLYRRQPQESGPLVFVESIQ